MVTFNDKKLHLTDSTFINFDFPIKDVLTIKKDKILVLLKFPGDSQDDENVMCFDLKGELLWKICSNTLGYPDGPSQITSIRLVGEELVVFRYIGVDEYINILDGKIIRDEFIK